MNAPDTLPDDTAAEAAARAHAEAHGDPGTPVSPPPTRPASLLARIAELGTAAQASIPGLYAWSVTVAPAAWGKGGSPFAKVLALLGIAALGAGLGLEHRFPRRARAASVWGLALTSALVWAITPTALTPVRLEATRGLAGMLGWALFAFASAAPPIPRDDDDRLVEGAPLRPRTRMPRGDSLFMALGALIACILQLIGWHTPGAERAVLVRLVCLAAGLAVLGAATSIALARHSRRFPAPYRVRMRDALPWLVLLLLLGSTGAILLLLLR